MPEDLYLIFDEKIDKIGNQFRWMGCLQIEMHTFYKNADPLNGWKVDVIVITEHLQNNLINTRTA